MLDMSISPLISSCLAAPLMIFAFSFIIILEMIFPGELSSFFFKSLLLFAGDPSLDAVAESSETLDGVDPPLLFRLLEVPTDETSFLSDARETLGTLDLAALTDNFVTLIAFAG